MRIASLLLSLGLCGLLPGCRGQSPEGGQQAEPISAAAKPGESASQQALASETETPVGENAEVDPAELLGPSIEQLLAMRLPAERAAEGWVRLFDGYSLFGWQQVEPAANWRVEDGAIVADAGPVGLLCTSVTWRDYELEFEYRAPQSTNAGVFLRTPVQPTAPATDCYELNIAPPENPFPTGGLVGRARPLIDVHAPASDGDTTEPEEPRWHRFRVRVVGDRVTAYHDDQLTVDYTDPNPLPRNWIGLQHNSGPVAYRDLQIRPILDTKLLPAQDLSGGWQPATDNPPKFQLQPDGSLMIGGERGHLETRDQWQDLALFAELQTVSDNANGGIFVRCMPGEDMNGYECQVSNARLPGPARQPKDAGTGGIFRRQDARFVVGEDRQWQAVLLVVDGPRFSSWVDGIQVTDWTDDRAADPNPRRGRRLEAGSVMLQAHDPQSRWQIRQLQIGRL